MLPRSWSRAIAVVLILTNLGSANPALAASTEELERMLRALQEQVDALRKALERTKAERAKSPAQPAPAPTVTAPAPRAAQPTVTVPSAAVPPTAIVQPPTAARPDSAAPPPPARADGLSDFKLGGYGSTRFEASDLNHLSDTFTFRRFVLTGDATIGERLRSVVELELERLTELEVERRTPKENGRRDFSQSIEGSDHSEISLEQAWMQFTLTDAARFRAGMLLVPLGRFNLTHDDNRWDLPRRSLVDRGVSVLPVTSAWSEVGMGFTGDIPTERWGRFNYHLYVMNGVALDSSLETIARSSRELETEVEITPRRGTANIDLKRDKAGAFRLAWSPALGDEIAASAYYGRYTPSFLPSEALWAAALDGKTTLGPFELEGEYVFTRYEGIARVARGFAAAVLERELAAGTPLDVTVDFELGGLASIKHGYWLEGRYRFFPDALRDTVFGRKLENPQFVVVTRWEQAWLQGLVEDITFTNGELIHLAKQNRWINRATLGLAYRPVPLVVFQLAFERTWTTPGQSLAAVTNFLPAAPKESTANAVLLGVAFGF